MREMENELMPGKKESKKRGRENSVCVCVSGSRKQEGYCYRYEC